MIGLYLKQIIEVFVTDTGDFMFRKSWLEVFICYQPEIPASFQYVFIGNAMNKLIVLAPCTLQFKILPE